MAKIKQEVRTKLSAREEDDMIVLGHRSPNHYERQRRSAEPRQAYPSGYYDEETKGIFDKLASVDRLTGRAGSVEKARPNASPRKSSRLIDSTRSSNVVDKL